MRVGWYVACAGAIGALAAACGAAALCDPAPSSSPTPSASPTPLGYKVWGNLNVVFLSQDASGPGLQPIEGPSFAAGGPAAPVSPYDPLSGAPLVPGNVQQDQFEFNTAWTDGRYNAGIAFGAETLIGDRTNEAYWVEPLEEQDNPHLGPNPMGFSIVFPTHPGTDDYDGTRLDVSHAWFESSNGGLGILGGWFSLEQWAGFVFNPPTTTNALPSLLLKTPESLNPNTVVVPGWAGSPATLPMRGIDVRYGVSGPVTIEAADAELPSPPGTPARLESLSAGHFDDDGHGAIFQMIHVHTGGDPISTTLGFGASPQVDATDQGLFATSTLFGQHETIAGGRAVFPVGTATDGTIEYARSSYSADGLGKPGSVGGAWTHGILTRTIRDAAVSLHYYRFEPTFATMALPYGVPEDVWSVAYSWPGPWLKSNYQLVDSSTIGVNREGPMLSYARTSGAFNVAADYSDFRQIVPFTSADFQELGFIDGFFLVQTDPAAATLGEFRRTRAYADEKIGDIDVGVDLVDDGLHRDGIGSPLDAVTYDAPQYVVSLSRSVAAPSDFAVNYGYFGMRGTWADGAATNVDYGMRFGQIGEQFHDRTGETMITLRRSVMGGAPYFGALGLLHYGSPDFTGTTILIERRFQL